MQLRLDDDDRAVHVHADDALLFRYRYIDDVPAHETPKPHIHPLRTLGGQTLTLYRPHDHRWHTGLTVTIPSVSGHNFWGGNTYVPGRGYVQLPNNGRIDHLAWTHMVGDGARAVLEEALRWVTVDGDLLLTEQRSLTVEDVRPDLGYWALDVSLVLRNAAGTALTFGTPATAGLAGAGYWGLHWRGVRSFTGGTVLAAGGRTGVDQVHGQPATWLAYQGLHDGVDSGSTLVWIDRPRPERYPTRWYAKNDEFPSVTAAFVFDEEYVLPAGGELRPAYRLLVIDGHWGATGSSATSPST